jgi:hypothetical protein
MRGEFLHISRLEKNQQDFHREDIRLDCMAIAVRIGSWSMLTWDSRWLSGLSSCKIVQMRFGDGETWPVFAPDSCSPVSHHSFSVLTTTSTWMLIRTGTVHLMPSGDSTLLAVGCHTRRASSCLSDKHHVRRREGVLQSAKHGQLHGIRGMLSIEN